MVIMRPFSLSPVYGEALVTALPASFEQFSEARHSAGRHLLHVYAAEDASGLRCGCSTLAETIEEAEKEPAQSLSLRNELNAMTARIHQLQEERQRLEMHCTLRSGSALRIH